MTRFFLKRRFNEEKDQRARSPDYIQDDPIEAISPKFLMASDQIFNDRCLPTIPKKRKISKNIENESKKQNKNNDERSIRYKQKIDQTTIVDVNNNHYFQPKIFCIDEFNWANIFSYLGYENYVKSRVFSVCKHLRYRVYQSSNFWDEAFAYVFRKHNQRRILSNKTKKLFILQMIQDYNRQQSQELFYQYGESLPFRISTVHIPNDFQSLCYVKHGEHFYEFHDIENGLMFACFEGVFHLYLEETPRRMTIHTYIERGRDDSNCTLEIRVAGTNKPFYIFDYLQTVKGGIKKLFQELGLVEADLKIGSTINPRFENLAFGPVTNDPYFIWFFNSIISRIPLPLENVYRHVNLDLERCGVDDEENRHIDRFLELHDMLVED